MENSITMSLHKVCKLVQLGIWFNWSNFALSAWQHIRDVQHLLGGCGHLLLPVGLFNLSILATQRPLNNHFTVVRCQLCDAEHTTTVNMPACHRVQSIFVPTSRIVQWIELIFKIALVRIGLEPLHWPCYVGSEQDPPVKISYVHHHRRWWCHLHETYAVRRTRQDNVGTSCMHKHIMVTVDILTLLPRSCSVTTWNLSGLIWHRTQMM
jgi:hypothetical protein